MTQDIQHPTIEECHTVGAQGGLTDTPEERARFEAYMRGHCWSVGTYKQEQKCYDTTLVRMLYGVWRDRGAIRAAMVK